VTWLIILLVALAVLAVGAGLFYRSRRVPLEPTPATPEVEAAKGGVDVLERPEPELVEAGSDTQVLEPEVAEPEVLDEPELIEEEPEPEPEPEPPAEKPTFRDRLGKARDGLSGALGGLRGRSIDEDAWEELEEALILADVGVPTTMAMLDRVRDRAKAEKAKDFDGALALLRDEMEIELGDADISLAIEGEPAIWMFVGVNGVGKTTTIGKLAKREADDGKKLVLAAGDTFRAAAAEQLETWADRSDAGFVRGAEGADPGSVVFDAVEHAAAVNADLVLADTAGRLHNKANLMEELRKVRRVAENDGSAKGGIVLAIQSELGIPVKLVGLGEGIEDLVEFDPHEFVDALFA